jgi:hypothetical protein
MPGSEKSRMLYDIGRDVAWLWNGGVLRWGGYFQLCYFRSIAANLSFVPSTVTSWLFVQLEYEMLREVVLCMALCPGNVTCSVCVCVWRKVMICSCDLFACGSSGSACGTSGMPSDRLYSTHSTELVKYSSTLYFFWLMFHKAASKYKETTTWGPYLDVFYVLNSPRVWNDTETSLFFLTALILWMKIWWCIRINGYMTPIPEPK